MIRGIASALISLLKNNKGRVLMESVKKGRHHKSVVSEGLRNGGTQAAKLMAKWRWGK